MCGSSTLAVELVSTIANSSLSSKSAAALYKSLRNWLLRGPGSEQGRKRLELESDFKSQDQNEPITFEEIMRREQEKVAARKAYDAVSDEGMNMTFVSCIVLTEGRHQRSKH